MSAWKLNEDCIKSQEISFSFSGEQKTPKMLIISVVDSKIYIFQVLQAYRRHTYSKGHIFYQSFSYFSEKNFCIRKFSDKKDIFPARYNTIQVNSHIKFKFVSEQTLNQICTPTSQQEKCKKSRIKILTTATFHISYAFTQSQFRKGAPEFSNRNNTHQS